MADPETYGVRARYMARAMAEDTPAAGRFAGALVEESDRIFRAGAARLFGRSRALSRQIGTVVLRYRFPRTT